MAITGFEKVDYWCYRPDLEPVIMTIARDDKTIATLILNAGRTWEQVLAARAGQSRTGRTIAEPSRSATSASQQSPKAGLTATDRLRFEPSGLPARQFRPETAKSNH